MVLPPFDFAAYLIWATGMMLEVHFYYTARPPEYRRRVWDRVLVHAEIQYKKPKFQNSLYQECGSLYWISGSAVVVSRGENSTHGMSQYPSTPTPSSSISGVTCNRPPKSVMPGSKAYHSTNLAPRASRSSMPDGFTQHAARRRLVCDIQYRTLCSKGVAA
eukprot:2269753-Rhodomonas_salina.2